MSESEDEKDLREVIYQDDTPFSGQRNLRHRWPKEIGPDDSGINCLMMLTRQFNVQLGAPAEWEASNPDRRAEEKANPVLKDAWKVAPLQTAESHRQLQLQLEKLGAGGMTAFADLEDSSLMSSTLWSRRRFALLRTVTSDGKTAWMEEEWEKDNRARFDVIVINNAENQRTGIDIPSAIRARCGVKDFVTPTTTLRRILARYPMYIRVRFTPSDSDTETLESLSTFVMELPYGLEIEGKSNRRYNLAATVRLRTAVPGDADCIRLFDEQGFNVVPDSEGFVYNDLSWEIGAAGHTYYLYYLACDKEWLATKETRAAHTRDFKRPGILSETWQKGFALMQAAMREVQLEAEQRKAASLDHTQAASEESIRPSLESGNDVAGGQSTQPSQRKNKRTAGHDATATPLNTKRPRRRALEEIRETPESPDRQEQSRPQPNGLDQTEHQSALVLGENERGLRLRHETFSPDLSTPRDTTAPGPVKQETEETSTSY
ncbi:hypothetical protein CSIM01_10481 [Colletotrichum simmondsii]|uniref:Uncharacterized protein n=1 Tax=Colletotrichum simmondsii TaxID=703756 RepID=A0A135SQK7_9PEZI|nr:hypothetical protein CSIM01_10481 [Colletotrichum simmondsii]